MKALAALSVLVGLTLALSAWVGRDVAHAAGLRGWPPSESSSRLLQHGRVLCTATVKSQVGVGHVVTVRYVLHNVTKHRVTVRLWFSGEFTVNAADGTTYDTAARYEALPGIPPPLPKEIRGGATLHLGWQGVAVRWPGPLEITPMCLGKPLPVLRVGVAVPWPRPAESAAVGEVVAASNHLLDDCTPQTPGVAVDGQIHPSRGDGPPLDAQCSVSLTWDGNVLQAQVLVLVPRGLAGVQLYQPYETLWPITQFLPLAAAPPYEAIAWEFVVTRYRTTPVAFSTITATCNGTGFSGGDGGSSPAVDSLPASC